MKKTILILFLVSLFGNLGLNFGNAAPINASDIVTNWSSDDEPSANFTTNVWSASGNTVNNGGNNYGTLISDFSASGNWTFSSTLTPTGSFADNDVMGLVFGWQDSGNLYSFTWEGGGISAYDGIELIKWENGSPTILASDPATFFTDETDYLFTVSRIGNDISVSIDQGLTNIYSTTVTDSTFLSGNIGFLTASQDTDFTDTDFTQQEAVVPEPTSLAIWGIGALGAGFVAARRRRKRIQ